MTQFLFWAQQVGIIFFLATAVMVLLGLSSRPSPRLDNRLFLMALLGPAVLWLCWFSQWMIFREIDTLFWSRLMAGDVAGIFRVGSGGLIFGTLLATAALALGRSIAALYLGALLLASLWLILLMHPVPHYVPVPAWLDKVGWFGLLVGGALALVVIHQRFRLRLEWWYRPASAAAGLVALAALGSLVALNLGARPVDLAPLSAVERIDRMGCLACHTMDGRGYPDPGGGLESAASRDEKTLLTFMRNPDAATAKRLGIRSEPTGAMAGLLLSDAEAQYLVGAMREQFPAATVSAMDEQWREVERIVADNSCLACHSLQDQGVAGGGMGGPLEASAYHDPAVMKRWLMTPTREMALELGLRDSPTGAMAAVPLNGEEAEQVAAWLQTLAPATP